MCVKIKAILSQSHVHAIIVLHYSDLIPNELHCYIFYNCLYKIGFYSKE